VKKIRELREIRSIKQVKNRHTAKENSVVERRDAT